MSHSSKTPSNCEFTHSIDQWITKWRKMFRIAYDHFPTQRVRRQPLTGNIILAHKITVLVVEDEVLLRVDTVDELTAQGLDVVEAANAGEAIKIFKSGSRFDCLFTDVDMPGAKDGLELASLVKSAWPPIEIIVTSGHRDVKSADLPKGGVFVGKPYSPEVIADLIKRLTSV